MTHIKAAVLGADSFQHDEGRGKSPRSETALDIAAGGRCQCGGFSIICSGWRRSCSSCCSRTLNQQLTAAKPFLIASTPVIGRGVYLIWIKACRADLLSPTAAEQDKPGYPTSFVSLDGDPNVEVDYSCHSDFSALYCTIPSLMARAELRTRVVLGQKDLGMIHTASLATPKLGS